MKCWFVFTAKKREWSVAHQGWTTSRNASNKWATPKLAALRNQFYILTPSFSPTASTLLQHLQRTHGRPWPWWPNMLYAVGRVLIYSLPPIPHFNVSVSEWVPLIREPFYPKKLIDECSKNWRGIMSVKIRSCSDGIDWSMMFICTHRRTYVV